MLEDSGLLYERNSDPEVTKYEHLLRKKAPKKIIINNIIPQYKQNNYGRWALHLLTTKEFIGWCGLKYRPERSIMI